MRESPATQETRRAVFVFAFTEFQRERFKIAERQSSFDTDF